MGLIGPMLVLSSGFLVSIPDYWCQVDELVEANWTAEQIKNFSSPSRLALLNLTLQFSCSPHNIEPGMCLLWLDSAIFQK